MRGKARVTRARQPRKPPVGYGLYRLVHRIRHPGVVHLTRRGYGHAPLRAWETAVGLRPRKMITAVRRRRATEQRLKGGILRR